MNPGPIFFSHSIGTRRSHPLRESKNRAAFYGSFLTDEHHAQKMATVTFIVHEKISLWPTRGQ